VLLILLLAFGQYEGTLLLAIACALMLLNRLIVMVRSKQSVVGGLLYPIGSTLLLLELIGSVFHYELNTPRWRSRKEIH